MTHVAAHFLERFRAEPPPPLPARPRRRAVPKHALIAGAAVAAGFGLAMAALPPFGTPQNVAKAYVQARFDDDPSAAWAVMCQPFQEAISYTSFEETVIGVNEYYFMPSDVDIAIDDVRGIDEPSGPAVRVGVTVTSDERNREDWALPIDLVLVEEGGAFRVCYPPGANGV
jgi:hypothetical protein